MSDSKFALGTVIATPNAIETLGRHGKSASEFIARHVTGDFGNLCEEDRELNEQALTEGSRIMSVYKLNETDTVYVITEADRSSTCCLMAEDY